MAIKLFCNACQQFIRNVDGKELGTLYGDEICEECQKHVDGVFHDVDKVAKQGIVRIERARDDIKAKLERMVKHVVKGE